MANQILMGMDGSGFYCPISEEIGVHRRIFLGLAEEVRVERGDGRPGGWRVGPTVPQHRELFARWLAHLDGPLARKIARAGSRRKQRRCVEALHRLGITADLAVPGAYRHHDRVGDT
jgi:hypothetical protein